MVAFIGVTVGDGSSSCMATGNRADATEQILMVTLLVMADLCDERGS